MEVVFAYLNIYKIIICLMKNIFNLNIADINVNYL